MAVTLKVEGTAPAKSDMPSYPYLARHKEGDPAYSGLIFVVTDYGIMCLTKDGASWHRGDSWTGLEWTEFQKKSFTPLHPSEVVTLHNHKWEF